MTTDLDEALTGAELVVETIVEEVEPKRTVLARAEELAAPGAILTTNTSSLSVDEVGGELQGPSASPVSTSSTRRSSSRSSRSSAARAPRPTRSRP